MSEWISRRVLEQRHPEWRKLSGEWEFLRQSYEGGREYLDANIFPHSPRETDADFKRRKAKAVYPNYVRSIIKAYRNHIFKHSDGVRRDVWDDDYRRWLGNVTFRGDDSNGFWSDVATMLMLFGTTYVLVDMPRLEEVATPDEMLTPYLVHILPQNVVDWSLDAYGGLAWVRIRECLPGDANPRQVREERIRYRLWTPTEWELYSETGELLDGGPHPVGSVPLVPLRFEKSCENELSGTTFMCDFARMNRMVANSISLRDRFLADSALQILTIQIHYMNESGGEASNPQILKMGSVLEYGEGVGHPPTFIGPDASVAEHMMAHVEQLIREMYRLATLSERQGIAQGDRQSGTAKQMDFEDTNAALAAFADALEIAETKATKFWFRWLGRSWDSSWVIDYPDRFNVQALHEEIRAALDVQRLYESAAPSFVAAYLRRLSTRLLDDATVEQMAQFEEDLSHYAAPTASNA